jgi:hypothetical protein
MDLVWGPETETFLGASMCYAPDVASIRRGLGIPNDLMVRPQDRNRLTPGVEPCL